MSSNFIIHFPGKSKQHRSGSRHAGDDHEDFIPIKKDECISKCEDTEGCQGWNFITANEKCRIFQTLLTRIDDDAFDSGIVTSMY